MWTGICNNLPESLLLISFINHIICSSAPLKSCKHAFHTIHCTMEWGANHHTTHLHGFDKAPLIILLEFFVRLLSHLTIIIATGYFLLGIFSNLRITIRMLLLLLACPSCHIRWNYLPSQIYYCCEQPMNTLPPTTHNMHSQKFRN